MKKKKGFIAQILAMTEAALGIGGSPSKKTKGPRAHRKEGLTNFEKYAEKQRKKGLKLFKFEGEEIWAINEKNARRKAKKRGSTVEA